MIVCFRRAATLAESLTEAELDARMVREPERQQATTVRAMVMEGPQSLHRM